VAIKKAIVQISMFYDERNIPRSFFENASLEDLALEMDQGDCVGQHKLVSIETVPAEKVADELKEFGNDGAFFGDCDGPQP